MNGLNRIPPKTGIAGLTLMSSIFAVMIPVLAQELAAQGQPHTHEIHTPAGLTQAPLSQCWPLLMRHWKH